MTVRRAMRYKDCGVEPAGLVGENMEANEKAPDFSLPDQNGEQVSLKDFRGKTVVLFFFPKADTPG